MIRTRVSLVTLGDPGTPTGGYLYHRRLAEAAPTYAGQIRFVSFPDAAFPLPIAAGRGVLADAARDDVVLVDSIAAAYAAPWLRRVRKPVVGILHQQPGGIDHGVLRTRVQAALDRYAYRQMRMLLVASESLRDLIGDSHPDVRVVAPGCDVATAPEPQPADLRRGRAAALLCVANWVPRKGIAELISAFELLPLGAATLHLVGDTDVDPRYASEVRRRIEPIRDRVVVHGVVTKERVAAFYRDADAFVMPSSSEPYGTVYGEAMAMGLPVVGWRAGNLPYLATHEREGLIVEQGDIAALAGALRRVVEDVELRARLGAAARERAATFPTWDATAATVFTALRDVQHEARRRDL